MNAFFKLYKVFQSLLNLLQYCFYFMFCFLAIRHVLILTPQPGIKAQTPEFKGEVLTTKPPEMSPQLYILLQ